MNEQVRRVLPEFGANVLATFSGLAVGWWSGLPLAPALVASLVAGTGGYFLGGRLTRLSLRAFDLARLAPPGQLGYRFTALPMELAGMAGGKATNLAKLAQAGYPVPAGAVLLPKAFDQDQLTAAGSTALSAILQQLGPGPYAIRSSALAEDSASASFAGAYESLLDIAAEDVAEAVAKVRSSRGANRVDDYAAAKGLPAGDLAVIIQRMVPAELAGVLFTADPLTGDLDRMQGSLVHGLGEALVSGTSNGEPFTFERPSGSFIGPDALVGGARQLHSLAHHIEEFFDGVAQDIEWAQADGKIQILQSRPITTMTVWDPVTAERNDSLAGTCLWSATNLSEANPEAQTPLTISWSRIQQEHGGPSIKIRGREMMGYIGGRPFANLSVQLSAQGPRAKADPRAAYLKLAPLWGSLPATVPVPLVPLTRADWREEGPRLLVSLAKVLRHQLGLKGFLSSSGTSVQRLGAAAAECATPTDLARLWKQQLFPASLRAFWAVIAATNGRAEPVESELQHLVGAQDAAVLLANIAGLAGGLESLGPAAGLQQVSQGSLSREEYLQHFGHRGYNETELAWPRPSEDPSWLDRMLASAADSDLAALQRRQQQAFEDALDRLRHRHPKQAPRLERQLRQRAARAARRERVRSEAVRWTGVTRQFALRAGELLNIGQDVFLLTVPELFAALAGERMAYEHFEVRRETLRRYRALPPLPGFIVGRFDPFEWAQDQARNTDYFVAGAVPSTARRPGGIQGTAASSGVAEGVVRLLERVGDAEELLPGEILVTSLTNIGWTPIFPRAAAIITDIGAPLSHAAIVARELGIPAVVGCGDATRRLHTGDRVRVDGAHGTVELLGCHPEV